MNTLPKNRQQSILALLQDADSLSIHDLAEALEVSPMTIHRDLNMLEESGQVLKIHGGAVLADKNPTTGTTGNNCAMCHQPISPRHAFILECASGEQKSGCCPHCGLMMGCGESTPSVILATDFIYGHKINAINASYLIGSQVTLCCVPSVLAFASAEDGERFQLGFGGELFNYHHAQAYLRNTHVEAKHAH